MRVIEVELVDDGCIPALSSNAISVSLLSDDTP